MTTPSDLRNERRRYIEEVADDLRSGYLRFYIESINHAASLYDMPQWAVPAAWYENTDPNVLASFADKTREAIEGFHKLAKKAPGAPGLPGLNRTMAVKLHRMAARGIVSQYNNLRNLAGDRSGPVPLCEAVPND